MTSATSPTASTTSEALASRADVVLRRVAFGCVIALYVLLFPYHPPLRSPNELCRLWQTRALVEYGTIDINQALRDYGYVGDLSRKDGKYYPSKAPLLSFAAVPVYKVMRDLGGGGVHAVPEVALVFWSRLFLTVLPTLAMLVLVRRFLRAFVSPRIADGVTAAYALGTLAFSYSLLFMSHQTTAVLVFAAFYVLWRVLRGDWEGARAWLGLLLAGALAGATVVAEYTGALPVVALFAYGAIAVLADRTRSWGARLKRLSTAGGLAVVGALPFVALLMWYHDAAFGHPLHSGYKYLNDAAYQPWHLGGFLGIRYPDPRAFILSFFSPLRGLFALAPFLLAAFPGLFLMWRHRTSLAASAQHEAAPTTGRSADAAIFWFAVLLVLGYTYFTSSFSYDSWGWTTGPRHLTPLVPFLLLPVAFAVHRASLRAPAFAAVIAGLCAGAIAVTGVTTFVNYIPDSVSNPVFGLALPLFEQGYLPPSLLTAAGVPNPVAGWILLAILCGAAMLTFALLAPRGGDGVRVRFVPAAVGAACCAAYLLLLAVATRHDAGDLGAQQHLKSVWLVKPGTSLELWPER